MASCDIPNSVTKFLGLSKPLFQRNVQLLTFGFVVVVFSEEDFADAVEESNEKNTKSGQKLVIVSV